jgi:uncharacterized membrane protein YtjA (UPF0391 family)
MRIQVSLGVRDHEPAMDSTLIGVSRAVHRPFIPHTHYLRDTETIGRPRGAVITRRIPMLGWALAFLILALVAAIFGFGGIAVGFAAIAKILFFLFLVLFVISLIFRLVRGGSPRTI